MPKIFSHAFAALFFAMTLFRTAFASVANPSTGDHNVVIYAIAAIVVVVIIAAFVLLRGRR